MINQPQNTGEVQSAGLSTEGDLPPQELTISAAKICYFIMKARQFDTKDEVTEPDPASNASDDQMIAVLEDHADDPVQEELTALVAAMSEDEQVEMVALLWLGRGDGTLEEWPDLRAEALRVHGTRGVSTARYLLGTPLVSDYLEEALAVLGKSCDQDEAEHP